MPIIQSRDCPRCGDIKQLEVSQGGLDRYKVGEHAQNAFPELDADDRERLITGICPGCWTALFGEPDDED